MSPASTNQRSSADLTLGKRHWPAAVGGVRAAGGSHQANVPAAPQASGKWNRGGSERATRNVVPAQKPGPQRPHRGFSGGLSVFVHRLWVVPVVPGGLFAALPVL